MAVPKRRRTSAKRDSRRTHDKATLPGVTECPQCGAPKLSHRVCKSCGYYKNRQVIATAE